ncbi:MAG: AI-2E family transporter [Acidobacteria bacterium]|nr:AI-2E family transporter [Acidobacteriota bacterium]MCW5968457.1 AI-2E family transporter [Blastocatellales bacterium]
MREAESSRTQGSTAERLARLERRLGESHSPLAWMRWVPVVVLALVAGGAILVGARIVLVPLLGSVALAYLLAPVVSWFERRGWSRSTSTLLALTSATVVVLLALIFILPGLWEQLQTSFAQARALITDQARVERAMDRVRQASPIVYEYLESSIGDLHDPSRQAQLRNTAAEWLQRGLFGLVDLTASIVDLLLIPFFVYYLLSDYRRIRSHIELLIPPRFRTTTGELIHQLNEVLSTYTRNQMLIGLTMGVLYGVGFASLRVPLGMTIGLTAGLLNFIPYLGTISGLILSLGFVALDGAGLGRIAAVLAVFVGVQMLEGYYLTPRLLSTSLNLHPMVVLLGLMIGGSLFGLLGIILAVPIVAAGKVIFNFLDTLYRESNFYRRPAAGLLSGAGHPIDIITSPSDPASPTSDPDDSSPRPPRIVITTGELRSRLPQPPKNK